MITAALAAAAAVLCLCSPSPGGRFQRIHGARGQPRTAGPGRLPAVVATLAGVGVAVVGGTPGRLVITGSVLVAAVVVLVRRHRDHRRRQGDRAAVCEGCQVLSSQLQAGQLPEGALRIAARSSPVLEAAAATSAIGGDVAASLRIASQRPGCAGLATLAAAWELSRHTGAPVADLIARVAEQQREDLRLSGVVAGELAAPRATGTLLALLPVVGMGMAAAMGADPIHFLGNTAIGSWCLLVAAALSVGGVAWTEWLASTGTES